MTSISVDFNNVGADGRVLASFRQAGHLNVGDHAKLSDPGEAEEFDAVVAMIDDESRTVAFDVMWEPVSIPVPGVFRFVTWVHESFLNASPASGSTNPSMGIWINPGAQVRSLADAVV